MLIEEIEIKKLLGCESLTLSFKDNLKSVFVVQSEPACAVRPLLTIAIQLICSSKYAEAESLVEFPHLRQGSVRVVFLLPRKNCADGVGIINLVDDDNAPGDSDDFGSLSDSDTPCTSQHAREREMRRQRLKRKRLHGRPKVAHYRRISGYRNLKSDPGRIKYSIDGQSARICSITLFLSRFFMDTDYVFPCLQDVEAHFNGNWLQLISTRLNDKWNQNENLEDLFERFVQIFVRDIRYTKEHLLSKLTSSCLRGNIALNVVEKSKLLKIFLDTRKVFEYITCSEYTVWFLIPHRNEYIDMQYLSTEVINFEKMMTCIQLKTDAKKRRYIWSEVEHTTQEMLLIAFQLALAFHCQQQLIYLQKLDKLKDHQSLEFATTAYLQKYDAHGSNWSKVNYLQRIIDVCIKFSLTAVIEYPGGLPVQPVNAHLIKCYQNCDSGAWSMRVAEENSCSVDSFVDSLANDLKRA